MQISSKLFNEQQLRRFSNLTGEIQNIQDKIASGKKILKASDDPIGAINLSAVNDQKKLLGQFEKNVGVAQSRLELADKTLGETINVLTRLLELTTLAGNGAYDAFNHEAIAREMEQLEDILLTQVNSKDARGQSLFSGFNTQVAAFTKNFDGSVVYNGDRGVNSLQISENMTVATSIDGGSAFMKISTVDGNRSVFDIVKGAINAVRTSGEIASTITVDTRAKMKFTLPNNNQTWSFSLQGTLGQQTISADISNNNITGLVDAINNKTSVTGIAASIDSATGDVILVDNSSGNININNVKIDGYDFAVDNVTSFIEVTPIDGSNKATASSVKLTDNGQLIKESLQNFENAVKNVSVQKTYVGAQAAKADKQLDNIRIRQTAIDAEVARLSDADLASLVTSLQTHMITRDAAQQAFAKIASQSLFDFLR